MKLKQVNKIIKIILLIISLIILCIPFISNYYLKVNMIYYRMMFIINENIYNNITTIVVVYLITIALISCIKFNKYSLINAIYAISIVVSYYKIEHLNKSVVTISMMLFSIFIITFSKLIEDKKFKIATYAFMFITFISTYFIYIF